MLQLSPVFIIEQNLVEFSAVMLVDVFYTTRRNASVYTM